MPEPKWHAVVLAASRGPDDPMAKAFGVAHKCALPIAGKPMLQWVLEALQKSGIARPIVVSIDNVDVAEKLSPTPGLISAQRSRESAPASALAAIESLGHYPVLLTTGDHPLLTPEMIHAMQAAASVGTADVLVGLATDETILRKYPGNKRTFFNLAGTRVSGCNLFVVSNANGLKLLRRWQQLEKDRKKPWKLVFAFGLRPLLVYLSGRLTPARAFAMASEKLGTTVKPVLLPFAEAAIDVDKPSDHAEAERILNARLAPA